MRPRVRRRLAGDAAYQQGNYAEAVKQSKAALSLAEELSNQSCFEHPPRFVRGFFCLVARE